MSEDKLGDQRERRHRRDRHILEFEPQIQDEMVESLNKFLEQHGIKLDEYLFPGPESKSFRITERITVPASSEGGKLFSPGRGKIVFREFKLIPVNSYTRSNVQLRVQKGDGTRLNMGSLIQGQSSSPLAPGNVNSWIYPDNFVLERNRNLDFIFTNPGASAGIIDIEAKGWKL